MKKTLLIFSLLTLISITGCEQLFRDPSESPDRPFNSSGLPPSINDSFITAITTTSVKVIWRTDKPASTIVMYGLNTNYGINLTKTDYVVDHEIMLSNLTRGTTYFLQIKSVDGIGNTIIRDLGSFVTENIFVDVTGPTISGLSATPNPTAGATSVLITATVSDQNSVITSAEYFTDRTGNNGDGNFMSASDGNFNSLSENIVSTLNISTWTTGIAKRIYVHGKDSSANWGAFSYVDITISSGTIKPGGDTTGPTVSNINATPNPTAGATSVVVTAVISDQTTGGSILSSAEYFVNTTGSNGTGISLSAIDGSFNSVTENIMTTIFTSSWTAGTTKRIYIHGKDNTPNWGSFSYIDISVTNSKPDSTSNTVVTYTLGSYTGNKPQQAVWIEDSNGNFIRTLYVSNFTASNKNTLPTWNNKSGGTTNGTSGATRNVGTHNNQWNCVDKNNNTVQPGTYKYRIETRQEGGGAAAAYTGNITIGNSSAATAGNTGGFITSLSAVYTP